jgi:hypothetical protein
MGNKDMLTARRAKLLAELVEAGILVLSNKVPGFEEAMQRQGFYPCWAVVKADRLVIIEGFSRVLLDEWSGPVGRTWVRFVKQGPLGDLLSATPEANTRIGKKQLRRGACLGSCHGTLEEAYLCLADQEEKGAADLEGQAELYLQEQDWLIEEIEKLRGQLREVKQRYRTAVRDIPREQLRVTTLSKWVQRAQRLRRDQA